MNSGRKKKRNISGILLLDKPKGITSNTALQAVKRLYQANKAGHTGNLDPLATGMLPVCLGEATKISAFLLDGNKHYRAECRLGITTTTGDSEGAILDEKPVPALSPRQLESVLARFRGEIEQVPPMYSALKHQGQPLYKLARQGLEVERKSRRISIFRLTADICSPETLTLDVECTKGTYIRTLAEDIGNALGCGAYLTGLRRLAVEPFTGQSMLTVDQLNGLAEQGNEQDLAALDECLLPIDAALPAWPKVIVNRELSGYLRQGQAVWLPKAPTEGLLKIYGEQPGALEPVFMAVGRVLDDGRIAPKRLILADK